MEHNLSDTLKKQETILNYQGGLLATKLIQRDRKDFKPISLEPHDLFILSQANICSDVEGTKNEESKIEEKPIQERTQSLMKTTKLIFKQETRKHDIWKGILKYKVRNSRRKIESEGL